MTTRSFDISRVRILSQLKLYWVQFIGGSVERRSLHSSLCMLCFANVLFFTSSSSSFSWIVVVCPPSSSCPPRNTVFGENVCNMPLHVSKQNLGAKAKKKRSHCLVFVVVVCAALLLLLNLYSCGYFSPDSTLIVNRVTLAIILWKSPQYEII